MQNYTQPTAYMINWDIRVRINETLVCFDLNTRKWILFGTQADLTDAKIQCIKIKDWLLQDRQIAEAILRGDKEITASIVRMRPMAPPPLFRHRYERKAEVRT